MRMSNRTMQLLAVTAAGCSLALGGAATAGAAPAPDVITGTGGDDRLVGTPGADEINGLRGADNLVGRAGADLLNGGRDPDVLRGGGGRDALLGGPGMDAIYGGPGRDHVEPRAHHDLVYSGRGNDTIHFSFFGENQGPDYANCGGGFDRVYVEPRSDDEIDDSCERVFVTRPH